MVVSTVHIGRPPGSSVTDTGVIGEDQLRVAVYNRTAQHLWLAKIGARLGVFSGAASVSYRLVAYEAPDHVPNRRLALVGLKTTSVVMTTASEGVNVEHAVEVVDQGPSNKAAQVFSNSYVGLGIELDTVGQLGHGMIQAAFITADEERFFNKSGVNVPPDPFGSFSSSIEGHLAAWAVCHTNEEPRVPVNRTANTSTGDLTPTLEADFRDRNGAFGPGNDGVDDGDIVKRVHIQVRRVSDQVIFWSHTYLASASEQTANRTAKKYAGTTLVLGTEYEWRIRHQDQFDAWGDFANFLSYTPPSAGSVTLAGTPTGKQETVQPGPFEFTWNHATGLSTNAVEIRIKQDSAIIRTSGTIAKTVLDTATGSITWAETGFADLPWGGSFSYEVRGRDTNNVFSNWSAGRAFTTNAAPTVPSGLTPNASQIFTAFPLLQAQWTDSDDTTLTGLTGTFEITRPDDTIVTMTPTLNTGNNRWEFQTTATELNQFGTYTWRARSFDGTLYSGVTTVAADAVWSGNATFQYLQGPTVSVTAPLDDATITTSTPTITWTASAQATYRIQVAPTGGQSPQYDSGWITDSAARSFTLPAGIWHNTEVKDVTVRVQDSASLEGSDTATNVTLTYTPLADVTGLNAFAVAIGADPFPTAIRLEWEQTTEPAETFVKYLVYRDDLTDRPLAEVTSPTQTVFQDLFPTSGTEYTYTVRVLAQRDGETQIESAGATGNQTITLGGIVVASVTDPTTVRAVLRKVRDAERRHARRGIEKVYLPWGAITDPNTAPTSVRGKARYWEITGDYFLFEDDVADAFQRRAEWEAVDADGGTLNYRDELGHNRFVVIPAEGGMKFTDRIPDKRSNLRLVLREENFRLGLPLEVT